MNIQEVLDAAREVSTKTHISSEAAAVLIMQMRDVLAKAWDSGYRAGEADTQRAMDFGPYTPPPRKNPYREDESK